MPLVKIKPGLSHARYSAGDEFDASPAEMESFGDKFILVVEPEHEKPKPPVVETDATLGARKLAQEHGVNLALSGVIGSGKDGKITKADVVTLLDNQAAMEAFLDGDVEALIGDAE